MDELPDEVIFNEYLIAIDEMLTRCHDLILLDLIFKLLQRSV